jgi:hypothetical protein
MRYIFDVLKMFLLRKLIKNVKCGHFIYFTEGNYSEIYSNIEPKDFNKMIKTTYPLIVDDFMQKETLKDWKKLIDKA